MKQDKCCKQTKGSSRQKGSPIKLSNMSGRAKNFFVCLLITSALIIACGCSEKDKRNINFDNSSSDNLSETLLLKNFRPQSIYKIDKSKLQKGAFPIIDMHSHIYVKDEEALDAWVQTMDEVGIERSIVMTQKCGPQFDTIVAFFSKYPDRFDIWCALDYTGYDEPGYGPAAVAELERCVKIGAKGVGELGDKGKGLFYGNTGPAEGMHSDDSRMDPLFEKCAELGLVVNLHVGDPKWMYETMDSTNDGLMNSLSWRLDNKVDILGHEEMLSILENTVKRHPNTTFIACHFANCSYDLSIIGNLLDLYPNLYSDISARFCYIAATPRAAGKFFEKYQDRLLYGTDWGSNPTMYQLTYRILETEDEHFYGFEYGFNGYHWPLYGLDLKKEILEKIYRNNAIRMYDSN
jgi:uncharacterized protein